MGMLSQTKDICHKGFTWLSIFLESQENKIHLHKYWEKQTYADQRTRADAMKLFATQIIYGINMFSAFNLAQNNLFI